MKVTSARFVASAAEKGQWPQLSLPEIAFAGRSNVGKSSLINSITGRKGLVKVSKTPGKTRLLNFFVINEKLTFVDMPGYGFADVPAAVRKSWGAMVETYLTQSPRLKGVVSLVDIRRTPNEDDRNLLGWLAENGIPFVLVFTKSDKVPKGQRAAMTREAMKAISDLTGPMEGHVLFSSLTGEGKRELWAAIKKMVERAE